VFHYFHYSPRPGYHAKDLIHHLYIRFALLLICQVLLAAVAKHVHSWEGISTGAVAAVVSSVSHGRRGIISSILW
jgi:hypothetical protein